MNISQHTFVPFSRVRYSADLRWIYYPYAPINIPLHSYPFESVICLCNTTDNIDREVYYTNSVPYLLAYARPSYNDHFLYFLLFY